MSCTVFAPSLEEIHPRTKRAMSKPLGNLIMQLLQNISCSVGLFKVTHAECCLLSEKTSCCSLRQIERRMKLGDLLTTCCVWSLLAVSPHISDQMYPSQTRCYLHFYRLVPWFLNVSQQQMTPAGINMNSFLPALFPLFILHTEGTYTFR